MTHRPLLMLSPNSEIGGGVEAAKPTLTPAFRDTATKTVKTDPGLKPMPAELKGKEFSIDSGDLPSFEKPPVEQVREMLGKPTEDKPVKVETVKPVVEKPAAAAITKPQDKPVTKVEPVVTPPVTKPPTDKKVTDTTIKAPTAAARDYTGYDDDTVKAFKNMSDPAFQVMKRIVDERNTLIKNKQDQYLQHPQAYTLTPEYTELTNKAYLINKEREFWKQQLINVRAGKEWQDLQGFDPKTLEPVAGAAMKPSTEDDIELNNRLMRCDGLLQQVQQQGNQFVAKFKQTVDTDIANIAAERAKRFDWVADPKNLDRVVTVPDIGDVPIKQIREDFLNLFPQYLRNNPLADVAADLFAGVQIYASKIRELEGQHAVAIEKKDEVLRAEPNATTTGSEVNGKPKGLVFDMEGLPT